MIEPVAATFRKLLEENPGKSAASYREFLKKLKDRHCLLYNKLIPSFFVPYFLSQKHQKLLQTVVPEMMRLIEKCCDWAISDNAFADYLKIPSHVLPYLRIDGGLKRSVYIARLDTFFDGENVRFLEFNTDSPAGIGWGTLINQCFLETAVGAALHKLHPLTYDDLLESVLKILLTAYYERGGDEEFPTIAIVDWRDVRTAEEFKILRTFFETKGYPTVIGDPRDFKYLKGKLCLRKKPIDLVYRRVIVSELIAKKEEAADFFRAYEDHAFCMVNPLRSKIASYKTMLAALWNPRFESRFTAEEREFIKRHIPWSVRVHPEDALLTTSNNIENYLIEEREKLVMKAADSYGGRDVNLGNETDPGLWLHKIKEASAGNWILQKLIPIPTISVPLFYENKIRWAPKKANLNPFAMGGELTGVILRASESSIINVSAGGGILPVFRVQ